MWCSNCRQDLPAIAHGDMARCTQCGRFLKRHEGDGEPIFAPHAMEPVHVPNASAPQINVRSTDDDWLLEQQMARLRRRFSIPTAVTEPPAKPRKPPLARRVSAFVSWTMLSLGLAALACGGALLGWSYHARRADLWNIGVPVALGGHLGMLLGLILLVDYLWHANRRTAAELADIQARLAKFDQSMLASPSTFRSAVMPTSPNWRGPIRQMAGLSSSTETHAA
jgi:hypothetical protein